MKVTPKTEKEIVESRLIPKGWYPFTIAGAEDALSKAAKDRGETEPNMIALNIKVYKDNGFVFVKDWLMDTEFGAFKLRHAAETCNLLDSYEGGTLSAEDFEDKEGYCKIGISKGNDKFPDDSNKIEDYATHPPERKAKEDNKAAEAERISKGLPRGTQGPDDAAEDDIPWK